MKLYDLKVVPVGDHLMYSGPRRLPSGQTVQQHIYQAHYASGEINASGEIIPIFSSCGISRCINPTHLRPSLIANRLTESSTL